MKKVKSILKKSDKKKVAHQSKAKSATFDEVNIVATLHPADKDYGHMKIDEPKTPYSYSADKNQNIDAEEVARKLLQGGSPKVLSQFEDGSNTDVIQKKKEEFEKKRKQHYDEYKRAKMASQALDEDEEDEDEFQPGSSRS